MRIQAGFSVQKMRSWTIEVGIWNRISQVFAKLRDTRLSSSFEQQPCETQRINAVKRKHRDHKILGVEIGGVNYELARLAVTEVEYGVWK